LSFFSKPVPGAINWPLQSDEECWMVQFPEGTPPPVSRQRLISKLLVSEKGQVFRPERVVEDGVMFQPGGIYYTIMGLGKGSLTPMSCIHTTVADYVIVPPVPGHKFLFPKLADVEMMSSTLSLFSRDWLSVSSQIGGMETSGPLTSTDTISQAFLERVSQFKEIRTEFDSGITSYQVSQELGINHNVVYRYVTTQKGYCALKMENGKIQFAHDRNMSIVVPGQRNDQTSDGRRWYDILTGQGKLKEKLRFVNRELQGLVRFLRLNYCMVVRTDKGNYMELAIRRPR